MCVNPYYCFHLDDPAEGKSSVTLAGDTMPSNSEEGLQSNVKLPKTSDVVISQTNDVGGQDQSGQSESHEIRLHLACRLLFACVADIYMYVTQIMQFCCFVTACSTYVIL